LAVATQCTHKVIFLFFSLPSFHSIILVQRYKISNTVFWKNNFKLRLFLLAYFPYFEKKNESRLRKSPCCLYIPPCQHLNAWAYFNRVVHKSLPSVCVSSNHC
jgi:hypothetical protein